MNRKFLKNFLLVVLGSLIFAYSINLLLVPNHMGEGGVTGVTLLLKYTLGWDNAITYWIINVVLLIIGWRYLERETLYLTIVSVMCISVFQKILPSTGFIPENSMIIPLMAGAMIGVGLGLVFLGGGTTAGADIIVMILNKYFGINTSAGFLMIDTVVVLSTSFVIGLEKTVLTLAMLVVFTRIMNFILEGFNPKKSVTIISKESDKVAQAISQRIQRGITILKGEGYYTRNEKDVLFIVLSRNQILPLQRTVLEIDPTAFMIISNVQQVHGEGFSFYLDAETGQQIPHR